MTATTATQPTTLSPEDAALNLQARLHEAGCRIWTANGRNLKIKPASPEHLRPEIAPLKWALVAVLLRYGEHGDHGLEHLWRDPQPASPNAAMLAYLAAYERACDAQEAAS